MRHYGNRENPLIDFISPNGQHILQKPLERFGVPTKEMWIGSASG